ncbi:MAG: hypothetical protein AB7U63_05815 [Porticoccaceae bacterium]|jgi:hypothetical protein|nr:hypothetical protein [Porticoccaceae bacterium]
MTNQLGQLRYFIFIVVACFILIGPFLRQVLDVNNILFRQWTMFSQIGLGVHKINVKKSGDGQWHNLEIDAVVKAYRMIPADKPLSISHQDGLDRLMEELCVIYPNQLLQITAHRATLIGGWTLVADRQTIIC